MIRSLRDRLKTRFVERKRRPIPDPVPTLPLIRDPIFRVTRPALATFIQQIYGFAFNWDVISQPGMTLTYIVDGRLDSAAWQDRADDLRAGRKSSDLPLILNVLCADGLIRPGTYIVQSA